MRLSHVHGLWNGKIWRRWMFWKKRPIREKEDMGMILWSGWIGNPNLHGCYPFITIWIELGLMTAWLTLLFPASRGCSASLTCIIFAKKSLNQPVNVIIVGLSDHAWSGSVFWGGDKSDQRNKLKQLVQLVKAYFPMDGKYYMNFSDLGVRIVIWLWKNPLNYSVNVEPLIFT